MKRLNCQQFELIWLRSRARPPPPKSKHVRSFFRSQTINNYYFECFHTRTPIVIWIFSEIESVTLFNYSSWFPSFRWQKKKFRVLLDVRFLLFVAPYVLLTLNFRLISIHNFASVRVCVCEFMWSYMRVKLYSKLGSRQNAIHIQSTTK